MTYESREEIFSKDYLSIKDLQVLLGVDYGKSAEIIRNIKRKSDRLGIQGKIHTEDYFEYFNITDRARYCKGEQL